MSPTNPLSRRHFLESSVVAAGALAATDAWTLDPTPPGSSAGTPSVPPLDSQVFRQAVEDGDLPKVRAFLDRDPALMYSRNEKGVSVLVLAHLAFHPEIGALFLERGLEPDLVEAAFAGQVERLNALLEQNPGAVEQSHAFGGTALHAAMFAGQLPAVFALQGFGADVDRVAPGLGVSPLRYAFAGRDPRKVEEVVSSCLPNGGDPNTPQKDGDSLLHAAVRAGNVYLARQILRHGGEAAARDAHDRTPLVLARELGHGELVSCLEQATTIPRNHRATRFVRDASGAPFKFPEMPDLPRPLINRMVGFSHGHFAGVRELASKNPALVFALSTVDELSIEACAHTGQRDIVRFYLDHGLPLSLPTCLTLGEVSKARRFLEEDRRNIFERGPHDFPLTWYPSIAGGNVEAAALLVEFGIDLEIERRGLTGLHQAAAAGQADLVAFWLEKGANARAQARDEAGTTPLDLAQKGGHAQVLELLKRQ